MNEREADLYRMAVALMAARTDNKLVFTQEEIMDFGDFALATHTKNDDTVEIRLMRPVK